MSQHPERHPAGSPVPTYVINLARSVDRRAHITAELKKAGLGYEIITGVDGRNLDLNDPTLVDPLLLERDPFAAGTTGCALSHQQVYRRMIADGVDEALVLEDDVTLPADLASLAEAVAGELKGAELALLSCDSPEPCKMSVEGSTELPSARLLALPIDISQPRSSGAYVITREAAERMVRHVQPVQVSIDDWWFFYRAGAFDRLRCVVPLPVHKNPRFTSTIGYRSLGNGVTARLVGPLVSHKIPILHQALRYRRRRILRQWSRSELVDTPFVEKPSRLG
jgi:glycosyl transferase, family 25